MNTRVVVTGMGAITPIGNSVEAFWTAVKSNTVGIAPITHFDTADFKCKLAAEVKDFDPKQYMDPKTARRMETFCQFAVAAAKEALETSGIDMEKEDPFRVGVSVGSGIGSLQALERNEKRLLEKGPGRVEPLLVPLMISNMAAGNVSIQFGLKGKCINVVTACATGTHSIGEAFRSIQHGEADVMVAGGTEASITPIGVAGFTSLTALNTTDDVKKASIPFDQDRNGFVMGEGAGIVVLESLEHAQARGAKILAEVVGYGATCDAYHITSPAEDGSGAAKAMEFAMKDAGITPEQLHHDTVSAENARNPVCLYTMDDVMSEIMLSVKPENLFEQTEPLESEMIPMYILTNQNKVNGAGVLARDGVLDKIGELLGSDFYVLPSSTHEVILVPDNGNMQTKELEDMVKEVNATQVPPEDLLSDKVQYYDRAAKTLGRKQEKGLLERLSENKAQVQEREAKAPKERQKTKQEPSL